MTRETKQFQADVKEILDIVVRSLYSHREIFLRELISNASDALDKLRFAEISNKDWNTTSEEKHIRLEVDPDKKTLTIKDNGIGMTFDEVVENIGTIARSGTREFLQKAQEIKDKPELIGQFGVGFYSSFMVANKVVVHTTKAGTEQGTWWESDGTGNYTIEDVPRGDGHGTTITLFLKDFDKEEEAQDFTDTWTLKNTVKKYSDYIEFPIKMLVTEEEPEKDGDGIHIVGKTKKVTNDETVNSQKALWLKSASEITQEQYNEFYKHISRDWTDPFDLIHYKAEGTQEFSALLYIPSQLPFDYNHRGIKYGPSLYINRVFILQNCEDLVPTYLRFIRGVIDSSDLSLNISREMLQKDRQIQQIKKAVVSKLLGYFKMKLEKERDQYDTFWEKFGSTLKEGIASDYGNKDKLQDLCLFYSSHSEKFTTLKEYVERMKKDQKEIYYIIGESLSQVKGSPYLEKLKEKEYEVLYLIDPPDDWIMQSLTKYDDKMLRSITKEGLELDSEEEKKEKEQEVKEKTEEFKPLIDTIKNALSENIKDVTLSNRLVDSPVCLVSGAYDMSAHMERAMKAMGQAMPESKRILEINAKHPVFNKMKQSTKETQEEWAKVLYNQALLDEGSPIKDPHEFSRQICNLMMKANV